IEPVAVNSTAEDEMGHTSDDEDDGKRIGQPTDLALPNDNEPGRQISYAARIGVHSRVPDRSAGKEHHRRQGDDEGRHAEARRAETIEHANDSAHGEKSQ